MRVVAAAYDSELDSFRKRTFMARLAQVMSERTAPPEPLHVGWLTP